ncbi:MAG: DUF4347 domain-containing protein [Methylobacter sp.]|nr:DUF4347 domain-containing protein [Methylobacter sp.]
MKFIKTMLKEKSGKINSNLSAPAIDYGSHYKPRRTMMALEPRIMFDGAAVETAVDTVTDPKPPVQDAAAIEAAKLVEAAADVVPPAVQVDPASARTEILFIENNVTDYQILSDGAKPGTEVHILDASGDGLAQMAQVLDGRSGIDAIHIMSHGSEASVGLGSLPLTAQNLSAHAADLETIGQALNPNADILLYGCDVGKGSDGAAFISALAQTTHADIAASNDATGSARLGGDWTLEVVQGNIEAQPVVTAEQITLYDSVLAAYSGTITFAGSFDNVGGSTNSSNDVTYTVSGHQLKINGTAQSVYGYVGAGNSYLPSNYVAISSNDGAETTVTLSFTAGETFSPNAITIANSSSTGKNDNISLTITGSNSQSINTSSFGTFSGRVGTQKLTAIDLSSIGAVTFLTITRNGGGTFGWFGIDDFNVSNVQASLNAPTLSATGATPTYTEDGSAVDLFSSITAATNDSGQTFSGMTLTVTNVSDTTEYLVVNGIDVALSTSTSGLSLSTVGGESAGSVTVTGAGGTKTVTITGAVLSNANMGTLIDGITYRDSSQAPTTASSRVVTITGITDNGGSSNTASPNIAATVTVAAVNDAPTLTAFASTVDTVNEDTEVEITLAELKAQGDEADVDGTVDAFVIKAVSTGSLKIGTSAGAATAWAAGSNDTVDSTHQAYWTGAQDANGTLNAFTAVAKDNSGAESSTARQATVNVTAVNDAPSGVGNLTLAAVTQDTTNPTGTAISALTGYSFQDVDTGATSPGVLVVGNTANAVTEGAWQYSSDGGANWKPVATVAEGATALALSSATQVRFVPVANYSGTPPALSVRALDNTYVAAFSTTTGGTETRVIANSSTNGGATAISGSLNTISTSVTAKSTTSETPVQEEETPGSNLTQQNGNTDNKPNSDTGTGNNTNTGNNTGTGNNTNTDNNNNPSDTHGSDNSNTNNSGNNSSYNNNSNSGSSFSQTIVVDMKLNVDSHGNGTSGGTINIPSSAFAGLNTTGAVTITAAQSSGQSLPSFISVNPSTGAVTVKEGAVVTSPITVKVTIRDAQGKQVVVLVKVQPQKGKVQQQNQEQEEDQQTDDGERNQGDNSQGQGRGQNQRTHAEQIDKQLAHAGKPGLTQQLQMVGSKGFELQRQKLLDSLASLVSENKDAA